MKEPSIENRKEYQLALWSGKVVEELKSNDSETKALIDYNTKIHQSNRVENLLLPC
ncbi:hypothetical protein N9Y89_00685 [bacterium]|nr:hypothetical protein [bacterium]